MMAIRVNRVLQKENGLVLVLEWSRRGRQMKGNFKEDELERDKPWLKSDEEAKSKEEDENEKHGNAEVWAVLSD